MVNPSVYPPGLMESYYGPKTRERAVDAMDMVSVSVGDLFPDITDRIYNHGDDLSVIASSSVDALSSVDMTMIKPEHTVKILSSEHGYSIMGGQVYAGMLEAIKENIRARTGCEDVRLMVGAYKGFREPDEFIAHYDLKSRFDGKVYGYGPYDKDVPIETEIGTLYGIKKLFNGDWFVHAYYDDPREIYYNRQIQRAFKPFGMSYVRFETRSIYHMNFGNRSSNFLPMAVFNSPFIQQRYAFSCVLRHSPAGILCIDADRDLAALDKRITVSHLKKYGKMMRLFHAIDECIAVVDGGRWGFYIHAGGVIFGTFMHAHDDLFDLTNPKVLGGFKKNEKGEIVPMLINPAIKVIVLNQAWPGINYLGLDNTPIVIAGEDHAALWKADHCNPLITEVAQTAPDLQKAMDMAYDIYQTDKIIVFDGIFGHINCSPSMARLLMEKAPEVSRQVDEELLPMWLEQRGLNADQGVN
ncbi:MAG: hypothetical protein JRK53_18375 [Deltaproteobacteria bacterium]|nr:hypothetical protein [Deltaproteobacteria bacterium]